MSNPTVVDAVAYLKNQLPKGTGRPLAGDVVAALAIAEKQSKQEKQRYAYEQLLGQWQLGFVSGTQKKLPARPGAKPITQLGKGRFLPRWIDISITYGPQQALLNSTLIASQKNDDASELGAVVNKVALGGVSLQLSGPTRYWAKTNSLGFDFIYLRGAVGSLRLYDAPVRGGVEKAQAFAGLTLKDQAFFTFFLVEADYIAARGKGGGLALWTRVG